MAQKKYYGVQKGRQCGVFDTWEECRKQTSGFQGAIFKSFPTREQAEAFVQDHPDAEGLDKLTADPLRAIAYVDGSFDAASGTFSCGGVILWQGQTVEFSRSYQDAELASMRNVAGEIKGAQVAMQYCMEHDIKKLAIYHDYQGIAAWCDGSWQATKEGTKQYVQFYREACKKLEICFVKVKGHSNDFYNDRADRLAKQALGKA